MDSLEQLSAVLVEKTLNGTNTERPVNVSYCIVTMIWLNAVKTLKKMECIYFSIGF